MYALNIYAYIVKRQTIFPSGYYYWSIVHWYTWAYNVPVTHPGMNEQKSAEQSFQGAW